MRRSLAITTALSMILTLAALMPFAGNVAAQVPCTNEQADDITITAGGNNTNSTAETSHTVTARVDNASAQPCTGTLVDFALTSGPNFTVDPQHQEAVTDSTGHVSFTFQNDAPAADGEVDNFTLWVDQGANNDTPDVGEPQVDSTKTWENPEPTTATLTQIDGTDPAPVGADVEYRLNITDQFSQNVSGQDVWVDITGPNATTRDGATNALGNFDFSWTGTDAGTDTITGCADLNSSNACDGGEPSDTTTQTFEARVADQLTLSHVGPDTNTVGDSHEVEANVTDQFGDNLVGVDVDFKIISGPNAGVGALADGTDDTDGSGNASFTYTGGPTAGDDTICAWVDSDTDHAYNPAGPSEDGGNCSSPGGDDLTDTVVKTWEEGAPPAGAAASVDAEPEHDSNLSGSTHTIDVDARDANDAPTTATTIRADIRSGPNADQTSALAEVTCSPGGPETHECDIDDSALGGGPSLGTDTIRVFADLNDNNRWDEGEPFDDVTKTWTGLGTSLTITPTSDSAAIGTCNPFTVTLTDSAGRGVSGATLDVRSTHEEFDGTSGGAGTRPDPGYCDPGSGAGPNNSDVSEYTNAGQGVAPDGSTGRSGGELDMTTDANGQVTFGVTMESNHPGQVEVTVFCEDPSRCVNANSNNALDAGEANTTGTKTWTPGGAAGSENLTVAPKTDTNPDNTEHVLTVTLTNAAGDPVNDVRPNGVVETGPNAGQALACDLTGPTDGYPDGTTECRYTGTNGAGTDAIRVWVDTGDGRDTGPGAQPGEPQDTAEKTWTARAQFMAIDVTCENYVGGDSNFCFNPTDENTATFIAEVTNTNNTVTTADDTPASGVRVDFTVTSSSFGDGGFTDSGTDDTSCTTGADGTCSVQYENPTPVDGDHVLVEGTVAGQTNPGVAGNNSDDSEKGWQDRRVNDGGTVTLTPPAATNVIFDNHTVTATVTDQFLDPVQGAEVDFEISGGPNVGKNSFNQTTDANGQTSWTYTGDGGVGTDDIDAWSETGGTQNNMQDGNEPGDSARKGWRTEIVVDQVRIDMQDCDANPNNPNDTDWDDEADPNDVGTTHEVCATAFDDAGNPILGQEITFTLSGPGHFVDGDGNNLGTSVTVAMGADDRAHALIYSEQSGTTTVTATAGGQSDSGTKPWTGLGARNINCEPDSETVPSGTVQSVECRVADKFDNPVGGEDVAFEETGPGRFVQAGTFSCDPILTGGQNRCVFTTNSQGIVTIEVVTETNETGTQDIRGHIADDFYDGPGFDGSTPGGEPNDDECNQPANSPNPGDPAGNCFEIVTKMWTDVPEEGFARSVTLSSSHNAIRHGNALQLSGTVDSEEPSVCSPAGVMVTLEQDILGQPGGFQTIATLTTDSNGQFSHVMDADFNSVFVASVDQEGDCAQASSDPRNVLVRARVSLNRRPKTVRRGGSVRFRSQVLPCDNEMRNTRITLQKAIRGVFGTVARRQVNNNCAAIWTRTQNRNNVWRAIWGKQRQDLQRGGSVQRVTQVRGG